MRSHSRPQGRVIETEHLEIPMRDGIRLSARLWLPADAQERPVPAVFEYIPYRKADMVRARDERNHPVFASNGYASLRVDMRGSGDSEGHMPDMYTPEELADAHEVIGWIASQSWCSGSVGMFGTSWGGTASLQAAIDGPSALKAIIAVCATADRFKDDIHHMGGLMLTDTLEWGATLPAILAMPPRPDAVRGDWRRLWQERLDSLTYPVEAWIREDTNNAYWRFGSIAAQAEKLSCPVLAVGGWTDRYSNTVLTLAERNIENVWGIVGPWGHHYPDVGHPGPGIDFQNEALDWWDFWLSDSQEPPDWPKLRVWERTFDPPADALDRRNGEWRAFAGKPSAYTENQEMAFSDGRLVEKTAVAETLKQEKQDPPIAIPHDLRVGRAAGDTGYFGRYGGLPGDQREDDERSYSIETAPLSDGVHLLGACKLLLDVRSEQPLAQITARLCDVAPDGTSCLIAVAPRNLALTDDLTEANDPELGTAQRVEITFPTQSYRVAAGHRLRLALSQSYWPMVPPAPNSQTVEIDPATVVLQLPTLRETPPVNANPPAPARPREVAASYTQELLPALERIRDFAPDGTLIDGWHQPFTRQKFHGTDTRFGYDTKATHRIHPEDPASAKTEVQHRLVLERPDGCAEIDSALTMTVGERDFHIKATLRVHWDDEELAHRNWDLRIPRRVG